MLEMGKHGNEGAGAAARSCSNAIGSRQNARAAQVAAGAEWICHRNIVNLKTRRSLPPAAQAAPPGANVAISIRATLPA
jgi:hypothetical protein